MQKKKCNNRILTSQLAKDLGKHNAQHHMQQHKAIEDSSSCLTPHALNISRYKLVHKERHITIQ